MAKILQRFDIKRHDTLPILAPTVKGFASNPDGGTVTFSMKKLNSTDLPIVLDGTCPPISGSILDTDPNSLFYNTWKCVLQYPWQVGDTDVEGDYTGEFEVTLVGGKITIPDIEKCELRITVLPDINDT
jgi:hypothetical protein